MNALRISCPLAHQSGERLLILAITGNAAQRRSIEQELNLRSLLQKPSRELGLRGTGPRLRLVGTARAATSGRDSRA